jgi:branched-chain amino acid transport system substrate-binding protein
MKKIFIISTAAFTGLLILIFLFGRLYPFNKEPIHIALMAPVSGPQEAIGKEMVKGAKLYLDTINISGGVRGRKVSLTVYDDKNDKRTGMETAYQVAEADKALLVIGHYSNTISIDAGKIYKKIGIPAITAYAVDEAVVRGNEWFFRTVPNSGLYADLMANYTAKILKKTSASMIVDNNSYGFSIAEGFEKAARKSGIEIIKKWEFSSEDKDVEGKLTQIADELKAAENPGIILLAAREAEAAKILTLIKYHESDYSVISNLSTESFPNLLREYSKGKNPAEPEGIYAASPFLADVGNEKTYSFRKKFSEKYGKEPSAEAACAYDALFVALEAVRLAEIEGRLGSDRRRVKDSLTGFYNYATALRGVTGYIYFDSGGDAVKPPVMGVWRKGKLCSSSFQYLPAAGIEKRGIDNSLEKLLSGELIEIRGQTLSETPVVAVGISMNEVTVTDMKNAVFTLDFYLRFSYEGEFDEKSLVFVNAVEPVTLGTPVAEDRGLLRHRVYHVTADFKYMPDFKKYPFDEHDLCLEIRHPELTRDKLILVADTADMPESVNKNAGAVKINPDAGWRVGNVSVYEDILTNPSAFAADSLFSSDASGFSRIRADIRIQRKGSGFALKNFLPMFLIAAVLYAVYFMPADRLSFRVMIFTAALIANAHYHVMFAAKLGADCLCLIEYAFFAVYALTALAALISVSLYIAEKKQAAKKAGLLNLAGIILHPCIVLTVAVLMFVYTV